jgi:hypothetical protein
MTASSCWPTVLSVLRAATTSSTGRLGPLTTSSSCSSDSSTNVHHAAAVELQLQLVHLIAVQMVFAWRRRSSSSSWSILASEYYDDDDDDDDHPDQADIAGGRPIHVIASRGASPDTMAGEWPHGNAKEGERLEDDDHDHDGTDTGDDDEDWHDDDVIGVADAIVVALIKDLLDGEREQEREDRHFVRNSFFSSL